MPVARVGKFRTRTQAVTRLAKEEAQRQAADLVYIGEERRFVQGLADCITGRAEFLPAQANEIPKYKDDMS